MIKDHVGKIIDLVVTVPITYKYNMKIEPPGIIKQSSTII